MCHVMLGQWHGFGRKKKKKGRLSEWEAEAVVNVHHGLEVKRSQLTACFQFLIPPAAFFEVRW